MLLKNINSSEFSYILCLHFYFTLRIKFVTVQRVCKSHSSFKQVSNSYILVSEYLTQLSDLRIKGNINWLSFKLITLLSLILKLNYLSVKAQKFLNKILRHRKIDYGKQKSKSAFDIVQQMICWKDWKYIFVIHFIQMHQIMMP